MPSGAQRAGGEAKDRGLFATTHWSLVRAAGQGSESADSSAALETLCQTYWYPVYAHVRRRGYAVEDARDLTQEFFLRLLRAGILDAADPGRGRFRSFLLGVLKRFLSDARDVARALKRGGGRRPISWEQDVAEARLAAEPVDDLSPDQLYDRRWAMTVLEHAASRLRGEYSATGRLAHYEALRPYVAADHSAPSYADTATHLHTTESAVKSAIFRLRQRYYALVRDEVLQTLTDPAELEHELRQLAMIFD